MPRPKKNGQDATKPEIARFDISTETKNSIWGLLSFLLVIVSTLAFLDKAGSAGQVFDRGARLLFGWGFFLIPLSFLLLGVAFLKSISRRIYLSAVIGTVLFVLSALALFFIIGEGDMAARVVQGGYLGVALGYPLLHLLGFIASLIILVGLLVISVLMTLNVPLYQLVQKDETAVEEKPKVEDKLVIRHGGQDVSNVAVRPSGDPKPVAKPVPAKGEISDKEFVIRHLKSGKWTLPPLNLLNTDEGSPSTGDINASALIIKRTLANFGIEVEMGEVSVGPTVTQYTLRPAVGVKLSRIGALSPDLSLALAAHPLRIEAPIPGKSLVGIEVPNKKVAVVGLHNLFDQEEFTRSGFFLPLALGRDVSGSPVFAGLEKMPHLLIAGSTGSGKSVAINAVLLSLLYKHSPAVLKLILVDPKRVELSLYNDIPHLITPVITDNKKVLGALRWLVSEMDRRYELLSKVGSRDIFSYNAKMTAKDEPIMPLIIVVIDEMADLMAAFGRDVEAAIVRLAQMSRAIGIHLILSTQRPSVEVITGLIKANITSRVALQVASQIDSRTILDMAGAEKLLGRGDMLFLSGDTSKPRRVQAPFVTERETKEVVDFIKKQGEKWIQDTTSNDMQVDFDAHPSSGLGNSGGSNDDVGDDMYDDAKQVVLEAGKASASLLQRRLRVGYARAARLLDILEEKGIIGPGEGAKPREVYGAPESPLGMSVAPDPQAALAVNADSPEAERDEV